MNIVDDRYDFRPAGTDKLLDSGFLDRDNILPLSHLERQACYFIFSEPAMICQNMFLATEAMGLGGWMHCRILSREIFEALGFKVISPHRTPVLANPIGLDGIFESYCPPGAVPYLISDAEHRAGAVEISEEGIACAKAVCHYIYDTYGRFPGTVDAMHLMWMMQVHHLDTDHYDRFFRPGTYGTTDAAHMAA